MKIISLTLVFVTFLTQITCFSFDSVFYNEILNDNDSSCVAKGVGYRDPDIGIGLYDFLDDDVVYSSNLNSYDNFMTAYFDNLTHNFGVNYRSTCGYISIGMLLSYYDTFLNDNIIPESYDIASIGTTSNIIDRRNSPGVVRDIIKAPDNYDYSDDTYVFNLNAYEYYDEIFALSQTSFHAHLVVRGAKFGYYDFNDKYNPGIITFLELKNILNDHFSTTLSSFNFDYEILSVNDNMYYNSTMHSNVRKFAIDQIKAGNPVLLTIYKSKDIGHAVIAYDYDETTDKIYCHMGYGADMTHVTPESQGFVQYVSALVLNINTDHTHTNNYGVTTETDNQQKVNYYCYDYEHIETYGDFHTYNYTYLPNNAYSHFACCECGEYILEDHLNLAPSYDCVLCGDEHTHTYGRSYEWVSDKIHTTTCVCGETKSEGHVVSATALPIHGRKVCLLCGGLASEGYSQMAVGSLPHTENGSYITSDGITVLVDEDIEAFLNGTLEFIYPSIGETS